MEREHFSKGASNALKGIVIIFMIAHHLFRTPNMYKDFEICFQPFSEIFINRLCTYFKLCVGTFAFVSGYGLAKSFKNSKEAYSKFFFKRYLKTFFPFWISYIVIVTASQIIDNSFVSVYFDNDTNLFQGIIYVLLDFLGLSVYTQTPKFISEWWYMGACILFMLIIPAFVKLVQKFGALIPVVLITIIPRALGIGYLGGTSPLTFVMAPLLGVIFEHYDLFAKINTFTVPITKNKYVRKAVTFVLMLSILVLSFIFYYKVNARHVWEIHYAIVPTVFIIFFNRYVARWRWIEKALAFIGLHSANMYIAHMFILKYVKSYIYKMPYFALTVISLAIMSLVFSIILELIKKLTRVNKVEKLILRKIC